MNKTYYIVAAIIVIIVLGVFLRSNKTEAPIETPAQNATSTSLAQGKYILDTESSYIKWGAEFVSGLKREDGTVKLKSGNFEVTDDQIATGTFEIDMTTIADNQNKDRLVTHLKSADFFSVSEHPTAKFEITSFAPVNEETPLSGRYVLAGNLTVKGVSKPISFIAGIYSVDENLESNAEFAINRAEWDIKYNSSSFFQNLGDKAIRDAVEIGLVLKARKVAD